MQLDKYLKEKQPIIYQTFTNSLANHTLSHAYLIVGNPGTPLLETAKFLAKTVLCDDPSPLACSNCITCLRIESTSFLARRFDVTLIAMSRAINSSSVACLLSALDSYIGGSSFLRTGRCVSLSSVATGQNLPGWSAFFLPNRPSYLL